MTSLPEWAELILRSWGPQPAQGASVPDAAALSRYEATTQRFRDRWFELKVDVWPLFVQGEKLAIPAAQALLGLMIDLARSGSPEQLKRMRESLDEVARLEDEIRRAAEVLAATAAAHAELTRAQAIDGGIEAQDVAHLQSAAEALLAQSWHAPRPLGVGYYEATLSRKTAADSLSLLLHQLDALALDPIRLTDRARATIFNVTHDASPGYGAGDVKAARQRMRRSR